MGELQCKAGGWTPDMQLLLTLVCFARKSQCYYAAIETTQGVDGTGRKVMAVALCGEGRHRDLLGVCWRTSSR